MNTLVVCSQLIIALGIYNVWLLRVNQATAWRGGDSKTMEEEFRVYGLSREAMSRVKLAKLASATAVLVGIWYSPLAQVGALCMALLMLAAVLMHVRIHDPIRKSLPAASLLLLSLFVLVNQ